MRATISLGEDIFHCGELESAWHLHPFESGAVLGQAYQIAGPCGPTVVSEEVIRDRMGGWTWPEVTMELKPNAVRPKPRRPYRCGPVEQQAMELMVDKLIRAGVVESVTQAQVDEGSMWVVSAFVVPKPGARTPGAGELNEESVSRFFRLVVDERAVNEATSPLPSPWRTYLSTIPALLSQLPSEGPVYYGSLDVKDAYFCLPLASSCRDMFAFNYYGADGSIKLGRFVKMAM
ncbi:hypothetical protein FOZ63_018976, partial [Perkinsus olseni]